MPDEFLIVWNDAELLAVAHGEGVRGEVVGVATRVAGVARAAAPRSAHHRGRGGHGADTIHAETTTELGEWAAHVGWDQLHAYMRYPEFGTRNQPAQHFLEHAADRYAR